jgi:hypothetical protein
MKRIFSLFILLIYLLFLIVGLGFYTQQSDFTIAFSESTTYTRTNTNTSFERDHYTSYNNLNLYLKNISNKHNSIIKLYNDLGTTYEGRTIWMVKISDNPEVNEDDETEILFVGAHHGNELIANEMAIFIIETFTEGYGNDPRITWMVDTHEIWVIPMPNPDGTEYTLKAGSWRKNRSPNYSTDVPPDPIDPRIFPTSNGTDLARNYDIEWGDPDGPSGLIQRSATYAGSEPFSEYETQAIRDLVLAHNFSVYMDFHSGIELILYPWGYTGDPTPDNPLYERLAEKLSVLTGYDTRQGYDLYQSNGNPMDWIYYESRTIAFTVELSSPRMPEPKIIQPILENNIKQPLYLTGISGNLEVGSQLEIKHENIESQKTLGPFLINGTINGIPISPDLDVKIYYRLNDQDYKTIIMHNTDEKPNVYTGEIPKQKSGGIIHYFITVENEDILVSFPYQNDEFKFSIKEPSDDMAWLIKLYLISVIIIIVIVIVIVFKTLNKKDSR